jgi:hypothetical protein
VRTLKVSLGDQALTSAPWVVLRAVEQPGVLGRAWHAIRFWIK